MPDLPDDLAALLRDRADHAPVPPAPSDSLVRSVRRRQAVRAGATGFAGVAGVVAVVAVAAAAVRSSAPTAVRPVAPVTAAPTTPAIDDRYEFCDQPPTDHLVVTPFGTMLKYNRGCFVVRAGVPAKLTFTNLTAIPHNVVVAPDPGKAFAKTETLVKGERTTDTIDLGTLAPGDYTLYCDVHADMKAQLVAR